MKTQNEKTQTTLTATETTLVEHLLTGDGKLTSELAAEFGVSRETMYRRLSKLESDGLMVGTLVNGERGSGQSGDHGHELVWQFSSGSETEATEAQHVVKRIGGMVVRKSKKGQPSQKGLNNRKKVIAAVEQFGKCTVADIADETELSLVSIRKHVDAAEELAWKVQYNKATALEDRVVMPVEIKAVEEEEIAAAIKTSGSLVERFAGTVPGLAILVTETGFEVSGRFEVSSEAEAAKVLEAMASLGL